ncbi:PqqD family protein [Aquihabitans sp. McL0605]|uniref:PqqD family protein n=1 Tax=Aquihabitans sp. McL0605 TaxID=3415671 RepID=UPI003CEDDF2C
MTHERLDDQVMMINLETGAYFALEQAAADCWSALVEGAGPEDLVQVLVAGFEVDRAQAAVDVDAFLRSLVDESILSWSPEAPAVAIAPPVAAIPRAAYRPPQIEKHDDLEELLLLDPIHDIGPEGWPAVG